MNRQKILGILIFIIFVSIPTAILVYGYNNFYLKTKNFQILNPLGIEISSVSLDKDYINITVYNPNNYSVSLYFVALRMDNNLGATSMALSGDSNIFNNIFTIGPHEKIFLYYKIDPKIDQSIVSVINSVLVYGGYINIVLDYQSLEKKSGTIYYTYKI